MTVEFSGAVRAWDLGAGRREYISVSLPYGEARQVLRCDVFSAQTGKGEQRHQVLKHVKELRKAMVAGTFTPCGVHAGIRPRQRHLMCRDGLTVTFTLDAADKLPLTNGGHRFASLELIRTEAVQNGDQARVAAVDGLPIEVMLILDGDTQQDFVNLQLSKTVDRSHMLSLKVAAEKLPAKELPLLVKACAAARSLNEHRESPYHRQLRFDTIGFAPVQLATICCRSTTDASSSLVGLAKVARAGGFDTDQMTYAVIATFDALKEHAPQVLDGGKVLTPPPNGTKGASTMLAGLAVQLLYRMHALGEQIPSPESLKRLADSAAATLDEEIRGSFSANDKRSMMGAFADSFFADLEGEKHFGLPLELALILSPSAYSLPKLPPKPKAPRKQSSRQKQKPAAVQEALDAAPARLAA